MKYNRFMGEYDDNTIYQAGDVVNFDGASYYRKVPGKGISPIARKKPYTVWSRLNEALSTIFPLGGPGGGGASLPAAAPYQQLVTDGEGKWVPVDMLARKEEKLSELFAQASVQTAEADGVNAAELPFFQITVGKKYKVTFDGEDYLLIAQELQTEFAGAIPYIGTELDSGNWSVPFSIVNVQDATYFYTESVGTYSLGVYSVEETTHPIPAEYITGAPLTFNDFGKVLCVDYDPDNDRLIFRVDTIADTFLVIDGVLCDFDENEVTIDILRKRMYTPFYNARIQVGNTIYPVAAYVDNGNEIQLHYRDLDGEMHTVSVHGGDR